VIAFGDATIAFVPVTLGAGPTVRVRITCCVVPPPVAVSLIVYVPFGMIEFALMVKVDFPPPATDSALNVAITPVGTPEAEKLIGALNP